MHRNTTPLPQNFLFAYDESETFLGHFETHIAQTKEPDSSLFLDKSDSQASTGSDTISIENLAQPPIKRRLLGGMTNRFQRDAIKGQILSEQDKEMLLSKTKSEMPSKKEITSKSPKTFQLDTKSRTQSQYNLRSRNKTQLSSEQQEMKVRSVLGLLANHISTFFKLPKDYSLYSDIEKTDILESRIKYHRNSTS